MWPFSRREKDLNALPTISSDEHRWSIATADYDDSPLLVRINSSAKKWLGHKSLGIKLGFAVPLNSPNEGGMPDPEENQQLNDVEDVILREVEARATGILVLVLTTGTMREFVFYITDDADIATIHEVIQKSVSSHEVQCMAVKDPTWEAFKEFGEVQ
jgi:hypothetical protein